MNKLTLFRFKNIMLLSNLLANIIGVSIVMLLSRGVMQSFASDSSQFIGGAHLIFLPFSFLIPILVILFYEKPIRKYLDVRYAKKPVSEKAKIHARRRLLNEPFFMIALNLGIWMAASIFYPLALWLSNQSWPAILQTFFMSFNTGLITVAITFFVLEHVLQRRLAPFFFPKGGLYATPRTLRVNIGIRIAALVFACNTVPQIATIGFVMNTGMITENPAIILESFRSVLLLDSITFILVGIWLTFIVGINFRRPLREIIGVLQDVRKGRFDQRVQVTSNDEIGFAGDVINEMNSGLQERELIRDTFGKYVAKEVRDEVLSGRVPLDGEKRDVTILFSDLRNFTAMTEKTDPKLVIQIMNRYFKEMASAIQDEGGLVLQFVGDEIYAVFGAPISRSDHPSRAYRAAVDMRHRMKTLNHEFAANGWPGLRHGIGIHSGDALAANMGSPDRLSYLLVGDTVNLASRLQDLTKEIGTEVILSETTYLRLKKDLRDLSKLRLLAPVPIKGRSQPVPIYALP